MQQVPRPRARAASWKLQAAWTIEPYMLACVACEAVSTRPRRQKITYAGTSWKRSAR